MSEKEEKPTFSGFSYSHRTTKLSSCMGRVSLDSAGTITHSPSAGTRLGVISSKQSSKLSPASSGKLINPFSHSHRSNSLNRTSLGVASQDGKHKDSLVSPSFFGTPYVAILDISAHMVSILR